MTGTFSAQATAGQFEAVIRANRLLDVGVSWQDEIIFPKFDGLSIFNIAQTILQVFGLDTPYPLLPDVWHGDFPAGQVDRVVLFITDGLGYRLLNQFLHDDDDLRATISALSDGRGPLPLTSIVPSTTAVALPTFWSAQSPAQHGLVGTMMFLREFSTLVNMLHFRPASGPRLSGSMETWGLDPMGLVPVPTVGEALAQAEVPTHLLLDKAFLGTGLSQIMHRGVEHHYPHGGTLDIWPRLHELLVKTRGQRCYVHAYWPAVDVQSHLYGAQSKYIKNEVKHQMAALRDVLASDNVSDGRTLVMIAADHGHADVKQAFHLQRDTEAGQLYKGLRLTFGGDTRMSHLFLRNGCRADIEALVANGFADHLALIDTAEAISAGMFGPGKPHPELHHRLGDMLAISREGSRLADNLREQQGISMHGGMTDWEMMVPLMWSRR